MTEASPLKWTVCPGGDTKGRTLSRGGAGTGNVPGKFGLNTGEPEYSVFNQKRRRRMRPGVVGSFTVAALAQTPLQALTLMLTARVRSYLWEESPLIRLSAPGFSGWNLWERQEVRNVALPQGGGAGGGRLAAARGVAATEETGTTDPRHQPPT